MATAPAHLTCEYFTNPLGLDTRAPRLSWQLTDDRQGARQTAYQIIVGSSLAAVNDGRGDLWDTGKIDSGASVHIAYAGSPLQSRQRCWWRVRAWDSEGQPSPWSDVATWEMGLLNRADWAAKWIGAETVGGPYTSPPAAYLRKTFTVRGPVAAARLYITALGSHEFEINGKPAHNALFAPGRTEYTKRVPYHTFDVTSLIQPGENACGAILGDGWYCGHLHSDPRQTFGDRPRLLAQLHLTFADGSTQQIVSDNSWTFGEGPIRSSDMLMGEDYDARLEIPGWSTVSPTAPTSGSGSGAAASSDEEEPSEPQTFNSQNLEFKLPGHYLPPVKPRSVQSWRPVIVFEDPGIAINAHPAAPIRVVQEIKPVAPPVASLNKRRHIFDLGQNMVGRVRLRIRNAPPGMVIDLRHVEMLDKDGKPYTTALRTARATDHYTTKGGTEEFFEPHFTFHGFRFVEVRDYPGRNPTVDDVTGIVIHSDLDQTGSFECSDPMINQLQHNTIRSQKGNFLDFPTDCPQRDERLGWTGDAQVFIRTAAFNMNIAGFFTKWLQDMADSQRADGRIPSVVPHVDSIHDEGGPAWSDAAVICPWVVYLCYGDTRILDQCWPMMTLFMQYLIENSKNYIRADEHWKWKGYGDWLSMNAETPSDLIGTAFYAYCAGLMSKIATVLGKRDDANKYQQLFETVRQAWQKRFLTPEGVRVQTQTAYVLALHFDLLPKEDRPKVLAALVKDIEARSMHLSTGFVGTPYLNPVLTDNGKTDIAYALLQQKTFPSWLFPITHGATTMWERWDGWTPEKGFNDAGMNSYNHYAYGAVGEWMYAVVAGIDLDPQQPGYKHIIIRPQPGGTITWARASLDSNYGKIESSWKLEGDRLKLSVTIPPNTTATIRVPTSDPTSVTEGGQPAAKSAGVKTLESKSGVVEFEVGAGKYTFESRL